MGYATEQVTHQAHVQACQLITITFSLPSHLRILPAYEFYTRLFSTEN